MSLIAPAAIAPGASAQSDSTAVTIPGTPMTVYVGPRGECQSSYTIAGQLAGNYYFGPNPVGDCGFFLAFPKAVEGKKNPASLEGKTFGFEGQAGPSGLEDYAPGIQSPVTGNGSTATPYSQTTTFSAKPAGQGAEITETTTYVNGQPQFTSTYTVKNTGTEKFYARALYAGDLYVNGSDVGIGVFAGGPPRFIGGQNTNSGVVGGFVEVSPWADWQEAFWDQAIGLSEGDNGIWHDIEQSFAPEGATVFNDTIEPQEVDNGAGVEFAQNLSEGLEKGASVSFTVINRTQVPDQLKFSPAAQSLTAGQTASIGITALDTAGQPYASKAIRYTISGANPQSGSVNTNAAGQATISYVGNNPGADTIQMYLDLNGNGVPDLNEPAGTATVTWAPKPPVPNSTYTIKSIKANSNGTITITFVPTQSGQATLEVTVPTATISSAQAAKAKRCKKGQVKIHGKCRPISTVSGKVRANGIAGVPLTLSVKPSSKVKAALKKGRTVHLTAKLTYKSALGGAPVVKVFHLTVKPPKKKHH
jgi:hypothetical protein